VADQVDPLEGKGVQDRHDVTPQAVHGIRAHPLRGRRLPEAAEVRHDHGESGVDKLWHLMAPEIPGVRKAVQKEDRLSLAHHVDTQTDVARHHPDGASAGEPRPIVPVTHCHPHLRLAHVPQLF
jgi:hypothetical protein